MLKIESTQTGEASRLEWEMKIPPEKPFPGENGIQVRAVHTIGELEPFAAQWNELALNAPYRVPFLSHTWISSYMKYQLRGDEDWFCLVATDGTGLVGVLPLLIRRLKLPFVKCLVLRTPNNVHTLSVDFLVKEGYEEKVLREFAGFIKNIRPAVVYLEMKHLVSFSPTLQILDKGVEGIRGHRYQHGYGSVLPIQGTLMEYRQTLDAKFLRNLRRLDRKVSGLDDFHFSMLEGKNPVPGELDRFIRLEGSGWKARRGSAIRCKRDLTLFLKDLAIGLAGQDWLRWNFITADNKTIAGHFGIVFGKSYILFKIAFDESYSSFSPGFVLFDRMVDYAFRNREFDEINCLSDCTWGRKWQLKEIPYWHLRIFFGTGLSGTIYRIPFCLFARVSRSGVIRKIYRNVKAFLSRSDIAVKKK